MLKNHFKFALRLFYKDRFYSSLNLAGLTIGITIGIILLLVVQYDLGYDKHNVKHERIYRYTNKLSAPGVEFDVALAAPELAVYLQEDIPEIEQTTRLKLEGRSLVKVAGSSKSFYEEKMFRADSNVFKVFTIPMVKGNPKKALEGPNKAVLTESTAKKYFGEEDPVGQFLTLPDKENYEVTAIIEDLPPNSHMDIDILLSEVPDRGHIMGNNVSEAFWNPEVYLFLQFREGANTTAFYDKFPYVYDRTFKLFGDKIDGKVEPLLEPLAEVHFYSTKTGDFPKGDIKYVYAFIAIGAFIILLASVNYTNMATARAVKRTSEIAMRKVLGYGKSKLFMTILGEAILMSVISMILAIGLSYYIIEFTSLESLLNRELNFNLFSNEYLFIGIPALTLAIGFLSGIYPALYIPSLPMVEALKGTTIRLSGGWLRKSLISFQFIISLFVIICTVIMGAQIDFLRAQDLGFNKENVMLMQVPDQYNDSASISYFKNELLQHKDILNVTTSSGAPGLNYGNTVFKVEADEGMVQQKFISVYAQGGYLETLDLNVVEGRSFDPLNKADYERGFIINEAAAKALNWEEPVGKEIWYFHEQVKGKVIGVVKDFHIVSLHNKVEPVIMQLSQHVQPIINVRMSGNNIPQTIETIEKEWRNYATGYPFEYFFLDETFNEQYQEDQIQFRLLQILSYLSIFISILGLLGLSAFTAEQKTKEIGIRKVLGASVPRILFLFFKDYGKLILISFVVAVPVANYIIVEWMNNFQYQIDRSIWFFLLPGILVLAVALLTVSLQILKAVRENPVKALSYE